MSTSRTVCLAGLAGLAGLGSLATACSVPEEKILVSPDAQGEPFACLNQPLPTTAPAQITVSGTVIDPFSGNLLADASIQGFLVSATATPIFTVSSDPSGAFTHDQGTGGFPRAAFFKSTLNGYLDSYYFPATPLAGDYQLAIQQMNMAGVMTMASIGQLTIDMTMAQVIVAVVDCNGQPVAGATVSTNPPGGTIRYLSMGTPSPTAVATDGTTGAALVANIPVSNTTIQASVNGMTLRSYNIDTVAGAIIQAEIQP